MPARWCPGRCLSIAHPVRASSIPRRCRARESSPLTNSSARPTRARMSRGFIPAICRSGARSASSCGGSNAQGIPFTVTPGVPAFAAAAAALEPELTLPEVAQSVVLTRTSGRASSMPATRKACRRVRRDPRDAGDPSLHSRARQDPVADSFPALWRGVPGRGGVSRQASRPDEKIIRATLGHLVGEVDQETDIDRTALILVGEVLGGAGFPRQRAVQRRLRPPFSRRLCARRE